MDQDFSSLLDILPDFIVQEVYKNFEQIPVDEVILDVGRLVEIRSKDKSCKIINREVTYADIDYIVERIPAFTGDNRSGLDKTLHRISAMLNRNGRIIGLTIRVGRAIYGSAQIIGDLLDLGKSILIMGPPGIGKTTKLREIARVVAQKGKRVVVVDTSNEIAGEGDIPHLGIGEARRMQVLRPELQHAVMIEAVENHMPEVVIVDEIGTEMEARAARTIAERGVQLIATAHGQTIHNLIKNPTLSDLIGGIEIVTISDEEAKRRGTQKTVLERAQNPTFDILIEIKDRNTLYCYTDVARSVDNILRGSLAKPEIRTMQEDGKVAIVKTSKLSSDEADEMGFKEIDKSLIRIFPFSINRALLELAIKALQVNSDVVNSYEDADLILTTKAVLKRNSRLERISQDKGIPMYVIKSATNEHLVNFLKYIFKLETYEKDEEMEQVKEMIFAAIEKVKANGKPAELPAANPYVRRYEHQFISSQGYSSQSVGKEANRRVKIYGKQER